MPPRPRTPIDDITIGELGRRLDEIRGDVRELTSYMREHVENLPANYVPRTELDGRLGRVETDVTALKSDQVSGLRSTLLTLAASLPGLAGLALAVVKH